jgi:hypothetical protein
MMRLALTRQFVRQYGTLSKVDQQCCNDSLENLGTSFGDPRRHAGLGLRALRRGVYECRVNLKVRIGFTRHGDMLLVHTVGNHDTIRTWLRNNL